jgi:hypothetical protein
VNDQRPAELVLFERVAELEGAVDPAAVAAKVLDEVRGERVNAESAERVVRRIAELAREDSATREEHAARTAPASGSETLGNDQ